jgi:competence protein ComGC
MDKRRYKVRSEAFTLTELFIMLAVIAILAILVMPAFYRTRHRAHLISCTSRLKQIGLAFKTWAMDHTNLYPTQIPSTNGGSFEFATSGEAFRYFQVMSNELSTPRILVCPADKRNPVKEFESLSNSNLSYFVVLNADDARPEMILAGDRNLTNGTSLARGILTLTTNRPSGWTHELHNGCGQVLLNDGSVQQVNAPGLLKLVESSEGARLAIP